MSQTAGIEQLGTEITLPQACRIVGRGYGWVYARLLRGELEGRQVAGRFWVVDRHSAERLKAENARQGADRAQNGAPASAASDTEAT